MLRQGLGIYHLARFGGHADASLGQDSAAVPFLRQALLRADARHCQATVTRFTAERIPTGQRGGPFDAETRRRGGNAEKTEETPVASASTCRCPPLPGHGSSIHRGENPDRPAAGPIRRGDAEETPRKRRKRGKTQIRGVAEGRRFRRAGLPQGGSIRRRVPNSRKSLRFRPSGVLTLVGFDEVAAA